ncbi:hypothetical protein EDM56_17770 [Brevibacillus fluminis]|uniref:Uncharacterized protein n=1 Tax=Brevibacillus fluminis TaxID=511487 RepID=A0A3M8DCX1_9BACL|nr:hypothetical protein [Brevibacillus fluminis]RNB85848.1 hypothetical protein EDM56_17770 [Brevibacillus fluminis]
MTRINTEASTNLWTADETVFADAGITGVTEDNLDEVEQEVATEYREKGGPLTSQEIQNGVNKVVAIMAVDAATGHSNTITVAQLNEATGLTTAISQNEALYRSAIEDAGGGMFTFNTADDIAAMIDVVNAVALLTDGSVTSDNPADLNPQLHAPADTSDITYTFAGYAPSANVNIAIGTPENTATITNRNPGIGGTSTLSLMITSVTGYFQVVDYMITIPPTGAITIAKNVAN